MRGGRVFAKYARRFATTSFSRVSADSRSYERALCRRGGAGVTTARLCHRSISSHSSRTRPLAGLLTYWVVETVGRELGAWLNQETTSVHVGINVPPELLGAAAWSMRP